MTSTGSHALIFSNSHSCIKVFYSSDQETPSEECIVIFSAVGFRHLGTKLGGVDPLLREGFDVICVQSNCDDWHQNIFPDGINLLNEHLKKTYSSASGYGGSMGAFGALLYASKLNLNAVLALSPQFTISDEFDKRWAKMNEKIEWKYTMDMATSYAGKIFVCYDPLDLDAKHVEMIEHNFVNADIKSYKFNYGSHPITYYFHDANILKEILLAFANNDFIVPPIDRKQNQTYLKQLSIKLLHKKKARWAKALILRALELGDERSSTYLQASNCFRQLKDFQNAIRFAKKAIEAKDNNEMSHARHKAHLIALQKQSKFTH